MDVMNAAPISEEVRVAEPSIVQTALLSGATPDLEFLKDKRNSQDSLLERSQSEE